MGAEHLTLALEQLRDAFAAVRVPIDVPGSTDLVEHARAAAAQLDDYVLPRLSRLEAPLLVVVGGPTGVGKSTLVNSLMGRTVSAAGVIRPTTRAPVLVHHPADGPWFGADRLLPELARTTERAESPHTLQLVAEPSGPRGLAILDAMDVDSVVAEGRAQAARLLSAADLWLFVTSASRYADAVPWGYLSRAAERQAVVAVVLGRVPPDALPEVPTHLGQMMSQRGFSGSPLFVVPETAVDDDGLLPEVVVAPIRHWLSELYRDPQTRQATVVRTLEGAIGHLVRHGTELAAHLEELAEVGVHPDQAAALRAAVAALDAARDEWVAYVSQAFASVSSDAEPGVAVSAEPVLVGSGAGAGPAPAEPVTGGAVLGPQTEEGR